MRTRTSGGVGGVEPRGSPLSRLSCSLRQVSWLFPVKKVEPDPWKGVTVTEQRQRFLEVDQLN
jgi:hypothetical protein